MFIKLNKYIKIYLYYFNLCFVATNYFHMQIIKCLNMCEVLRSEYIPLTSQTIRNELLNSVYAGVLSESITNFTGKTVGNGTRWLIKCSQRTYYLCIYRRFTRKSCSSQYKNWYISKTTYSKISLVNKLQKTK